MSDMRLQDQTKEHYEEFPFDFLTAEDERNIESLQPAAFLRALLTRDDGRLAYFFGALGPLTERQVGFALRLDAPHIGDRVEAAQRLQAAFARVVPGWDMEHRTFWRPALDPALLASDLRLDANGVPMVPGTQEFWNLVFAATAPRERAFDAGIPDGGPVEFGWLCERVFSVERVPSLSRAAQARLDQLGIRNVALRHGDGTLGWQEFAPYARVLASAAAPRVPDALRAQLGEGGVLVIPVGGPNLQHLEVWHRLPGEQWRHERRGECRFVPLLGRDAWREAPETEA